MVLGTALAAASADPAYEAEIRAWRAEREAELTADDGWLTVAGLHFLKAGASSVGAGPLNDIVLPRGTAPDTLGVVEFQDGRVTVRAAEGRVLTINGERVRHAELRPGVDGRPPDEITTGSLTLFVHLSGARQAIRVKDANHSIRRDFTGLKWYPVRTEYRVDGRFVPYAEPKPVEVPNILGDIEHYSSPGSVAFSLGDAALTLEPVTTRDGLWFIFRDLTSGEETYPAARFLKAAPPENGRVTLDFNKAYNPPCAFNPHTTCPLPLEQNRLRVRIEAGELDYGHH